MFYINFLVEFYLTTEAARKTVINLIIFLDLFCPAIYSVKSLTSSSASS